MGQQPESALRDSQIALFKYVGIKEEELQFTNVNINDVLTKMAK